MEISDRRHHELLALIANRQAEDDQVRAAGRPVASRISPFATRIGAKQAEYQHSDRVPAPGKMARAVKEVLLVDPDGDGFLTAENTLRAYADVHACSDFHAARMRLLANPPDLLVTNIRLRAYNGMHLVHLAAGTPTRCIVYTSYDDLVLAREVQAAGAFYERAWRLPSALPAYARAALPRYDQRNPTVFDRRHIVRGGRRCTDR